MAIAKAWEPRGPMWLWISASLLIAAALFSPFSGRLQSTGLWAGKALAPEEAVDACPRGLQDALTDGWPSTIGMLGGTMPLVAIGISFLHAWWLPLAMLGAWSVLVAILERTPIASPWVDRYLMILLEHAQRREANYATAGDIMRAEAARELKEQLKGLLTVYSGKQVRAPSMKMAKAAPHGDALWLTRSRSDRS